MLYSGLNLSGFGFQLLDLVKLLSARLKTPLMNTDKLAISRNEKVQGQALFFVRLAQPC